MTKAVDYSFARPDPGTIKAAGYDFAVRYLGSDPGKRLTIGERDRLHAAGIAVGLVWETSASRTLGGEAAGRADAQEANRQADALGFPADRVIFYAVDFDASAGQISGPITSYFTGVASARGRTPGVYGSYFVIEYLVGGGLVTCGWQCAAWSGNGQGSGGEVEGRRLSQHACMFQRATPVLGGSCDHNDVLMEPTPWAWHPNQTTAPERLEQTMAVPVHCPDHTGDAQWLLVRDGNGKERRRFLGPDDARRLWAVGDITRTEPTVLTGADADWFLGFPELPPMHNYEAGVAGVWQILAYIRDHVASTAIDETALAQAIATAAGIEPGEVHELLERLTNVGKALAGEKD